MNEASEWSKKQLFYDEVKLKGNATTVKYASAPESYSVHNYYEFIPLQVKNAESDTKKKFYTKHKGTYKKLKMDHIICSFVIFKCNFAMEDQDDVNDHYRKVHNFSDGGVFHLRRREKIDVNMSLPFVIPDFKDFQSMGPNKQTAMINKI